MSKSIENLVMLFLFSLMMGVASSCSDDEESNPTDNLTGSWQSVRKEYFGYENDQKVITSFTPDISMTLSFLEDGTFIAKNAHNGSVTTSGNWKYVDEVIYIFDGDRLKNDYPVVSLTRSELVLEDTEITIYQDGIVRYDHCQIVYKRLP